jgi:phage shock protein A
MGVFTRILRLCKADLHGVMDQLEDKNLIVRQHLREMRENLKAKESRLEQISATCRRIQNDLEQHNQQIRKIDPDLDLAVRKGKDEIARMLIRKRLTLQGGSGHLQRQLEILDEEKTRTAQLLEEQRLQYEQLKVKAASFCREAEERRFETAAACMDTAFSWQPPGDDEIELELLQLKEALGSGGAS